MVRIKNSFITCTLLVLIINMFLVGRLEFVLSTIFEIIICCGLLLLLDTLEDIWNNYKKEKRGNVSGKNIGR